VPYGTVLERTRLQFKDSKKMLPRDARVCQFVPWKDLLHDATQSKNVEGVQWKVWGRDDAPTGKLDLSLFDARLYPSNKHVFTSNENDNRIINSGALTFTSRVRRPASGLSDQDINNAAQSQRRGLALSWRYRTESHWVKMISKFYRRATHTFPKGNCLEWG